MARLAQMIASRSPRSPSGKVRRNEPLPACGRPRAFMRKFQLCRICFRQLALRGDIPGVIKSSW